MDWLQWLSVILTIPGAVVDISMIIRMLKDRTQKKKR